ncbi:MAG: VWA domain-containing protein [Alphaproteobacteria bacterium]|nr:VWA domain-containing protein [Alphaproteobacteria bacterium]MCB9974393.1 VWA domain-containing protein [Rhodospirillales bacterium]
MKRLAHFFALVGLLLTAANASAAVREDKKETGEAILVLDGSGSMWGQIDGKAKITIAKDVLSDLLNDLPESRRLGLMAYGHRRKGDCSDIEEMAAVGADRRAIAEAVGKISPKGKTPMADSIKQAAEKLKYTEKKATVILISDGIETCAPDPCGVATALEQSGVDFTAHVVGFDISGENDEAQLRCIAENTGGKYVSASSAGELAQALKETVSAEPEKITVTKVRLRATELEGGLVIEKGLSWSVMDKTGAQVYTSENKGMVDIDIPPGAYDVEVTRPSDGLKGILEDIKISENTWKTVTIALTFPVEATVRSDAEGMAGTNVKIDWSGPKRQGDYISIAEKDADPQTYDSYQYVAQGNPAELRLPVEPGEYVIRYMLGRPIRNLAETAITVTPATATLMAKEEAIAGEEIDVEFTGPPAGSGDWVTVVPPEAEDKAYKNYAYSRQGSPAKIRMPLEPGDYELRFVQNNKKVLARRPIRVLEALATLKGPETAIAGEEVKVEFTGPKPASGDWITVTAPDAPAKKYNSYYYTRQGSPATVRMPLEPGEYELRFVQGNDKVIARQPITITQAAATLTAKDEAVTGETLSIQFTGPKAAASDWITVTKPDDPAKTYTDYQYAKGGSPANIRMPLEPGEYELRFVQGGEKILARKPVKVTQAVATLDGPATAPAGKVIDVAFSGPPFGSGDYIAIARPGDEAKKYESYVYTKLGSPAKLRIPKEPGSYELRFIQGNQKILARAPIEVLPGE